MSKDDLPYTKEATDLKASASSHAGEIIDQPLPWLKQLALLWTSRRAVVGAISCSSAAILIGFDMMLLGSIAANAEFVKTFGVYNTASETWSLPANRQLIWTLVQYVAQIVGALSTGQISDRFGRKITFFVTILFTIAGTLTEILCPSWQVWTVGKAFFGFAVGCMQSNTPVYVSELAPVHIRGFLLSLFQFWITFGVFLGACVLEGTSQISGPWSWKTAIATQFATGGLCLLFFILAAPESPYYLVSKGKMEAAESALRRLRGSEEVYNVAQDLEMIRETIELERASTDDSVTYLDCLRGINLRRTLLACLPLIMQQFLGFTLCGNYLAYFLGLAGLTDSFLVTVISQLIGLISVLVSFSLIERVGRRPLLLFGSLALLPCLAGMGILGYVNVGSSANNIGLAVVSILWNGLYYMSLGAVGWIIVGEVSSVRLRAKTTSLASICNSIINMAWAIAIPYLINADEANLGPKVGFIFLGPGVILTIILFFAIPETKSKTFEELDHLFETRTPARKFGSN